MTEQGHGEPGVEQRTLRGIRLAVILSFVLVVTQI